MPAVVQLRPQLEPVDKRLQDGGDVVANVDRENDCLGKEARLGPRRRQPHSLGRLGESDLGLKPWASNTLCREVSADSHMVR
jgi:hypothetical protein